MQNLPINFSFQLIQITKWKLGLEHFEKLHAKIKAEVKSENCEQEFLVPLDILSIPKTQLVVMSSFPFRLASSKKNSTRNNLKK